MKLKTIFFDFDDTLVNTRETAYARIDFAVRDSKDYLAERFYNNLLEANFQDIPYDLMMNYRRASKIIKVKAQQGTVQVLKYLSDNKYGLGIISNNSYSKIREKSLLANIPLKIFNKGIYCGRDTGTFKPDPNIFRILDENPAHSIIVGDSLVDYQFTRNINSDFIAVCTGSHSRTDFICEGLSSQRIATTLESCVQIINRIN